MSTTGLRRKMMISLGLPIPHGVLLEAVNRHTDQPFTKYDFSGAIAKTQSFLSAATQHGFHGQTHVEPSCKAISEQNLTNSAFETRRRLSSLDDIELLKQGGQHLEERYRAPSRPRSTVQLESMTVGSHVKRCCCGVAILYGNKHINCPLGED